MAEEDKVDATTGRRLARDWVTQHGLPSDPYRSQRRRYADLLLDRCVAESTRLRETEEQCWDRMNGAGEFLDGVWHACAARAATWYWRRDDVPEDKREEWDRLQARVWGRHDPHRIYELGYEEAGYGGVDRCALAASAAIYLERPWLRLACVDWMIVDAMVTDELAQYGEHLKATHLPAPKDPVKRAVFDSRTRGNAAVILREGRRHRPRPVLTWLGYQVVIPVATIGTSLYFQAFKTALAFAALTAIDWSIIIVRGVVRGVRRMRATAEELKTPKQRDYERYNGMCNVWRLLRGPVCNPTLVRAEMAKTTEAGAVWDSTAWAVVDRAIGIDPAVWVTEFPTT